MKRIFSLLCVILTVFLLGSFCANAITVDYSLATEQQSPTAEYFERERISIHKNNIILNYFIQESGHPKDVSGLYYPDYYGGSFITEDGDLEVMLTNKDGEKQINRIVNDIKYSYCQHSYASLVGMINTIRDRINKYKKSEIGYSRDYTSATLEDKNNIIVVAFKNLNPDKEKWFRQYIANVDYILFQNVLCDNQNTSLYSGQGIQHFPISNNMVYTVNSSSAFRFRHYTNAGWKYGFITCGHGFAVNNKVYDTNYANIIPIIEQGISEIGTVKNVKCYGNMDAALVEMNDIYDYSNTINNSPYTLTSTNDDLCHPVCNQYVYFYGRNHSADFGQVVSTSYSGEWEGISFYDLVKTTNSLSFGDSGGLLCTTQTNYSSDLVGVAKGIETTNNNVYSVFTKAYNIINTWFLWRY